MHQMDHESSKDQHLDVDLESGGTGSEEDTKDEPASGNRRAKNMLIPASGVLGFDGSDKGECSTNSYSYSGNSSQGQHISIELLIEGGKFGGQDGEHAPLLEKTQENEKRKVAKSKKAPKPPRPRKGPSLDTADLKLMKEISELAMKKRARNERMKALKKMKAAKSSSSMSSNSSLVAMVITLVFCLVIIFQGVCSGNSSGSNLQNSSGPSTAAKTNGLISIQLYDNILKNNGIRRSSESPNSRKQLFHSEFKSQKVKLD